MLAEFDFQKIKKDPRIKYYIRSPLHKSDFKEFRQDGRTFGFYYSHPLLKRITKLNQSSTKEPLFSGKIATVFIEFPRKQSEPAVLLLHETDPENLISQQGSVKKTKLEKETYKILKKHLNKAKVKVC